MWGRSVLLSAALGAALTPLNSTMVAVALPALGAAFGTPAPTVTLLVVTGYLVATLVFSVPAGSLADRAGHSRALTWGRWIFAAGAIAGTLAPSLSVVVGSRLLMALGGALIIPTAMALLRTAVPPERRSRAFGIMGAVMAGAAAIGPALGTWVVAHLGWRALFVLNVPLLAASWWLQPALEDQTHAGTPTREGTAARRTVEGAGPHPFDWQGSLLIGLALVLATFASRASGTTMVMLATVSATLFAVLVAHERRAPAPVLPLDLFRRREFVAGAGVIATQNLAMYSLLIQVPFLFGGGSSSNPRLGLAIVAMTATMAITSSVGGWLAERTATSAIVAGGGGIAAIGVIALGRLPASATPLEIAARLLLVGLGLGLSTGPANAAAIGAAPPSRSAAASATVSMLRYVGSIAGTVILSFAFADDGLGSARHHAALRIFAGALVVSALLGLALRSSPQEPADERP